jgi:hypothetical protein
MVCIWAASFQSFYNIKLAVKFKVFNSSSQCSVKTCCWCSISIIALDILSSTAMQHQNGRDWNALPEGTFNIESRKKLSEGS